MNPLLEQYLQEARENLKFIEQNIENLGDGDDELLNSVFRAVHTIKGGSGIVEFHAIKDITHSAEDLLDMLRSKKLEFQPSMIDVLFDAFDEVLNLIEAAEESGDIVESDEETVNTIVDELKDQMGKKGEVVVWKVPYTTIKNKEDILESDFSLPVIDDKLPRTMDNIIESNFQDKRLYAVMFDVDENCMLYGNDPVYAMGLLDDKLLNIYNCFSSDVSKEIFSGFENEDDDIVLRSKIIGFIYSSFEQMEDGIYNFLDDCYLLPLDITTLLDIDLDNIDSLDMIKDLSTAMSKEIKDKNIDNIKSSINEALGLINKSSRLGFVLKRVLSVLNVIDSKDLDLLEPFMQKVLNTHSVVDTPATESTPAVADETDEVIENNIELTQKDREVISSILIQQHEQLVNNDHDVLVNRVQKITSKCAKMLGQDCTSNDKEKILIWLESIIGDEVVCVTQAIAQIAPSVSNKVEEVKVKEVKVEEPIMKTKEPIVVEQNIQKTEAIEEVKKDIPKAKKKDLSKKDEKKDVIGKVVKVDQESIDSLMSLVGELLVAKNSLPYLADSVVEMEGEQIKRAILEKYSFINRLSNQLQDIIIGMRMLPISYVFDRYPKLVRDISKKLGKKVKLIQEGADTKLDKNIIEMLADPLIHIARNSLDHGLEGEDERIENGKDKVGEMIMKAYQESDKVIIEIIDDGRGIAVDKVADKCIAKGLLTQEQVDKMSHKEKTQLVTLPGLSTAEAITEFSGRGVGMDVVKKSLESFGGSIDITTKANEGTKILLAIPMSLAVTTLLQVSMNGNNYGFPMDLVSETVKIESADITYLNNDPYIYIRGQVVPLLFINQMLEEKSIEKKILSIVIITVKGNQLAVVVNDLLGQIDVVQKPLEGILENHALFSGAALLGNGQIIMILDSMGLLDLQMNNRS